MGTGRFGFRVALTCTFCGGALELDDASRTTRCAHCASLLRIVRPIGLPRYLVRDRLAAHEARFIIERELRQEQGEFRGQWRELKRLYVPYYRLTGLRLSLPRRARLSEEMDAVPSEEPVRTEAAEAIMLAPRELTLPADDSFAWGLASLGFRSHTITLEPLTDERRGQEILIGETMPLSEGDERFRKAVASVAAFGAAEGDGPLTDGTVISRAVIHFPLWLGWWSTGRVERTVQFDPIAKRVVSISEQIREPAIGKGAITDNAVMISCQPHRCPTCGVDLPEAPNAVSWQCRNCYRLYVDSDGTLNRAAIRIAAAPSGDVHWLPFWVCSEMPDQEDWRGLWKRLRYRTDRLILPAFAVRNPSRLLRLIHHYQRHPIDLGWQERDDLDLTGTEAAVSPNDMAAMLPLLVRAALWQEGHAPESVKSLSPIELPSPQLGWFPFKRGDYFLEESLSGAVVERAALAR